MSKYSIIVPTYNECENIPILAWLVNDVCTKHDINYELIVVDDNSPDGTQQAVKQLQYVFGAGRIILKTREKKLGLGSAYRHGLQYARCAAAGAGGRWMAGHAAAGGSGGGGSAALCTVRQSPQHWALGGCAPLPGHTPFACS